MKLMDISKKLDQWLLKCSHFFSWAGACLVVCILLQVILKIVFQSGSIALEELQWHFSAIMIMTGLAYADSRGTHVRVDIWHQKFSPQTKKMIESLGIVFFVFPFIFFMLLHAFPFWWDSIVRNESSLSPSGLPFRWIIKSFLPLGLILLFLSNFNRLIKLFIKTEKTK